MIVFYRLLSTGLGIGYIGKGAGTIAAMVCCFCWYLSGVNSYNNLSSIIVTSGIIIAGIWSAGKMEKYWGKDSRRVVIDEIAGMCVSLLLVPVTVKYLLAGFLLFRFFDITKPLFIRETEKLPGGWGVMIDDILAGLYTNLLLQLIIVCNFFK